ncbi:F0F1 ATP synthase subunit epsilon [Acidiferrobacter thiooxydans]|uniref:ATP synthase epsilon chain n=1 Tax=Acidiferrobacter thiooxydans TaxID=163359 RepID=A0A368HIS8_9GAMM|nr:F0F1 ATP synthase subunit epsilon [Acidiferrobacter thiooxydans]RCN57089.1 F0F1 ATP synthase subunit epsilon [Acidiferrobacter thiooxydans]
MDSFRIDIVNAEGPLFSEDAALVIAPLRDGDAGFLPGHSPLLAILRAGALRVQDADGGEQAFYVSGGFVEVQPRHVMVLADVGERAADIDEALAARAVEDAARRAEEQAGKTDYAHAEAELAQAIARLSVVRRYRSRTPYSAPEHTR